MYEKWSVRLRACFRSRHRITPLAELELAAASVQIQAMRGMRLDQCWHLQAVRRKTHDDLQDGMIESLYRCAVRSGQEFSG